MDVVVVCIFALVYLGMILGRLPGLALDRAGVALLGAILLIVTGRMSMAEAWQAVDLPTIVLLFGLMIVSAQFRLGGFYPAVTQRLSRAQVSPSTLLALVVITAGGLAALLTNDIVCLVMAPLVAKSCSRQQLDPRPFLMALACAANVGSAATLIGNPQNILVGQTLHLSFARYLLEGGVPAGLGLFVVWWVVRRRSSGSWRLATSLTVSETVHLDPGETIKGVVVLVGLVGCFLLAPWPRELPALAAAGILLVSRKMKSRKILALVDWQLLILFIGLFMVNYALLVTGLVDQTITYLNEVGVNLAHPAWLFLVTVPLTNLVSSVPATMLLLPAAQHPLAGAVLALASTFAGNLLVVGSIANLIVLDQARSLGIGISWREHARVGIPVALATLTIAGLWLAFLARFV